MTKSDDKRGKRIGEKAWPAFASWVSGCWQAIEEKRVSKQCALSPGLYVIATPIGNLGDITLRALWALRHVDAVLCEDTRVTAKLLSLYGIKKPLIACHDHNEEARIEDVISRLSEGQALGLVSDAGTPLLSDPGFRLVRAARGKNFPVIVLPGASALLTALAGAGLSTDRFTFIGFLASAKAARQKELAALANTPGTLVFYESPQRLAATLADMEAALGANRPAAVARELTKLYEETRTGRLQELAAHYADAPTPKGEVVILVQEAAPAKVDQMAWEKALGDALEIMSLRDAVEAVAKASGVKKSVVYQKALGMGG